MPDSSNPPSSLPLDGGEAVTHSLKIEPEYFQLVQSGRKRFEIRKDDRNFQEGDEVELREWHPGHLGDSESPERATGFTGHMLVFRIGYILRDERFLPPGYVCFQLEPIELTAQTGEKEGVK